jgi:hypothetical protein
MDPNGNNANNQEQLPTPGTEPPATQETEDTAPKGPIGSPSEDLEVFLDASETPDNMQTPEEEVANVSHDYSLSEEGEGDNISGNKELCKEGEYENENSSKRAKRPLQPETVE